MHSRHRNFILGVAALGVLVFIVYFAALQLGFYGDDWIFFDLAGTLSRSDYLARYFDPSAQTAWYRPVQGVLWMIGYAVFGGNPLGYHLVNVLLHYANCAMLFAIVRQVTRRDRLGWMAAAVFATLPTAVLAVLWPGVVDTLVAFFYLLAVLFWIRFLQQESKRAYALTIIAATLALLSKEISVTLPLTLFLIDRCVVARPITLAQLARRYAPFIVVGLVYLPIEWTVVQRSVFVQREGYAPGFSLVENFATYLGLLAFPWFFSAPLSYAWLAAMIGWLTYLIVWKKQFALLPLSVGAPLAILPVVPFPFVANRFLYLPLVLSAILLALLIDQIIQRQRALALIGITGIVLWGSVSILHATADFAENGRVARVPFRNVSQAHPTFPPDTLLYFIDAPVPGPNLMGMFFWRYGKNPVVKADDMSGVVGLRDHANTWVYIFDDQGNQKELPVAKTLALQATPQLPVNLSNQIQLDGYELVDANVTRGDTLVVLLYWRAMAKLDTDYNVSINLMDDHNSTIAAYAKPPRLAPTSAWTPGVVIVDAIQFPISVAPGAYRLAISLYDAATAERLQVLDASEQVSADRVILAPLVVEP